MDSISAPAFATPPLNHLLSLRDAVLRRDGRLFTRMERHQLRQLDTMPLDAAVLLARLATRKDGWIRRSTLNYPECSNTDLALDHLAGAAWLERWPQGEGHAPPPELLEGLTHSETRHLLLEAGLVPSSRAALDRQRLGRLLASPPPASRQLGLWEGSQAVGSTAMRLAELETWVRIPASKRRLLHLLELCHFGSRDQSLAQFTLESLGLQCFVSMPLSRRGLFSRRLDLEAVLDEGARLDILLESMQALSAALRGWRRGRPLPALAQRDSRLLLAEAWSLSAPLRQADGCREDSGAQLVRRIRLKALRAGASLLERLGRHGAAAAWQRLALSCGLEGDKRGELWQRLVLNLRHSGREESAAEALRQALGESLDPLSHHELERLARRAPTLLKAPVMGVALSRHPGHQKGRVLVRDASGAALTAEEAALRLLEREGWQGLHAENRLLRSLVGLCAWELIFHPIPDAFLHPMQRHPLDWGRPGFLERRKRKWQGLDRQLRRETHRETVRQRLESCAGLQNPLVDWWTLAESPDAKPWREGLLLLLEELPGAVLAEFTALLLEHPGACGHGLPDLLVWREASQGLKREWRLVEVKGPGDRLFAAQQLWHHWFLERGLPVHLLRLDRTTAPTT